MGNLRAAWMRSVATALCVCALAGPPLRAQPAPAPSRVALVIGEGAYRGGPTPAAPDDAGLVAQVLAGAGFDVTAARDLDGDGMRRAFRDFLDRAGAAGPDGIAVVYFAGRAVQSDGDDYLVPVDARLARPTDVPIEALRLADFTHALAGLPIQARVVVVDGAYAGGPGQGAPGLALVEAEQGSLVAFNAAPGTVAPATAGPYGAYAQALVGAVKQGGVPVAEVFDRVRLAVDQATKGAEVPWDSDRLTRSFTFFDRAPGAPAVASAGVPFASLAKRPLRDFPPVEAFDVALARDTVPAYVEFLAAFPDDPLARRIRLILAVRREALFWRDAASANTPAAYWTYLARYPDGPHAADARRRLARISAAVAPPPRFVPLAFDVPPPGPDDPPFDGPVVFVAPDLPPPPPPPVYLLPPVVEVLPQRPAPPAGPLLLPIPAPVAIPAVRPPVEPGAIAPPRGAANPYPHPRPYVRGANGDGLVVQSAPEPAPLPPPAPPARPVPQPAPAAAPAPRQPSAAQPPAPPVAPPAPPPRAPVPPQVPPGHAIPQPNAPATPSEPMPPLPSPTRRPPANAPNPAAAPPPPIPAPVRPSPDAGEGGPHRPAPAPAAPATRSPQPEPLPVPDRPLPAPKAEPAPPAPPEPHAPRPEPRTGAPDRPGSERPGPDRAEARPGQHREACGHPGEPPCRP